MNDSDKKYRLELGLKPVTFHETQLGLVAALKLVNAQVKIILVTSANLVRQSLVSIIHLDCPTGNGKENKHKHHS